MDQAAPAALVPSRPAPPDARTEPPQPLDGVRGVFWDAFKHLFPPHAIALQNDSGSVLVSWSMRDDPHATAAYAAPVVLRFEPELIEVMRSSDAPTRRRIAGSHEPYLRAGLVGYDPYAIPPKARIVVLG